MLKNITDLSGRVEVVIGGTTGLGRSIAIGLAESGADVVASGRRQEMVDMLAAQLETIGRRTIRHTVDVSDRPSIDSLRDAVLKDLGRVDILVNAAGQTFKKSTTEISEEDWYKVLDTNLTGMLRGCQSFYEPLKRSGHGRVINMGSLASFVGFYNVVAYNVSKMGVHSLTQTLAIEWARDQINVNALAPGVFPTEMNASLIEGTDRGREEELAGAAVFLASDAASFITGAIIAVDGGYLCSGVNS
jgi:NAD(P)-dependent dehydrogenase (short-subunit alcohol dehydrogenase family)